MGIGRSGQQRAQQCTWFPHPNCSACDRTVTRREWHSHSYGRRSGSDSNTTLCGDCYDLICVASTPILQAAQLTGATTPKILAEQLNEGRFGVLVQKPMTMV